MDEKHTSHETELIATFMQYDKHGKNNMVNICQEEKDAFLKEAIYHKSWSWLMSVVDKIESIKDDYHGAFQVFIHSNSCNIQSINMFKSDKNDYYFNDYTLESKIESTYTAVVKFIEWYNQKQKNES